MHDIYECISLLCGPYPCEGWVQFKHLLVRQWVCRSATGSLIFPSKLIKKGHNSSNLHNIYWECHYFYPIFYFVRELEYFFGIARTRYHKIDSFESKDMSCEKSFLININILCIFIFRGQHLFFWRKIYSSSIFKNYPPFPLIFFPDWNTIKKHCFIIIQPTPLGKVAYF